MIRVLHMIGSLELGGAQVMVMNLYRNMDRERFQFDFIVDHPEHSYFREEIEALGGRIYGMPTFRGVNLGEVISAWRDFFREHGEYEILHVHTRGYASLYIPIAKKYGRKVIIHSHSTSNGKGIRARIADVLCLPLRYQGDAFLACSREAGEWLFGRKRVRGDHFTIVRNAIDAQRYVFHENTRMRVRRELGIDGGAFVLGSVGRVTPSKNPEYILDVFAGLEKLRPDAVLLFVGDGDLLPRVKEKAREAGLVRKVVFTGARGDVADLLMAMDYYIFPSLWEGLGISLVEAQASGLPCLCSENIPAEAFITDLVEVMRLSQGSGAWAERIGSYTGHGKRTDRVEEVCGAGYDIRRTAGQLQEFYSSMAICGEDKDGAGTGKHYRSGL